MAAQPLRLLQLSRDNFSFILIFLAVLAGSLEPLGTGRVSASTVNPKTITNKKQTARESIPKTKEKALSAMSSSYAERASLTN